MRGVFDRGNKSGEGRGKNVSLSTNSRGLVSVLISRHEEQSIFPTRRALCNNMSAGRAREQYCLIFSSVRAPGDVITKTEGPLPSFKTDFPFLITSCNSRLVFRQPHAFNVKVQQQENVMSSNLVFLLNLRILIFPQS